MLRIEKLSEIQCQFSALVVDVWGVLCDGVVAHDEALLTLEEFHRRGPIILVSNTARSENDLASFLGDMGISSRYYTRILTAGQVCLNHLIVYNSLEGSLFHLGQPDDLQRLFGKTSFNLSSSINDASGILCTGLMHDFSDSSNEQLLLRQAKEQGCTFLCANPDVQVRIGSHIVPCAGSLASYYETLGGRVQYFGKPHSAIYNECKSILREYGVNGQFERVLAIGDTLETDIVGATLAGFKSLHVTNDFIETIQIGQPMADFSIPKLR